MTTEPLKPASSVQAIRFGSGYELDPGAYELRRSGRVLKLERIPMEILLLLVEQRGQLVTRDRIVEKVWGKEVFLDTDNSINAAIRKIRQVLKDDSDHPRFVQTVTGRGYRFIAPIEDVAPSGKGASSPPTENTSRRWKLTLVATLVVLACIAGAYMVRVHSTRLTQTDTIVLADFANTTGDAIFDDTLKQALTVTLRQSPFLNVLPESKVAKTLKLMTRDPATVLTPAIAGEVCQRAGSKAYIAGAIGNLGSEYVLGLKAVNCLNGDTVAQEQVTVAKKEQVLDALGQAATKLRSELGESLATVQRFDVPLTEATTSSLEALRAFSQGVKVWNSKGEDEAIPYFKRALELDPQFASAYVSLGVAYDNVERIGLAAESLSKAYELRERASERERFHILGIYYTHVTGELEKAIPLYKQWQAEYPTDPTPRTNLGNIFSSMGRYQEALAQHHDALRVEPNGVLIYENIALTNMYLGQLDASVSSVQAAFARNLDDSELHLLLQEIAFHRGDAAAREQQLAWGMGKPGVQDFFLAAEADFQASAGHIAKAREFSGRAVDAALRSGSKETAALWLCEWAVREAEVGNLQEAVKQADAAMALSESEDVQIMAGLVLARAGKEPGAMKIVRRLDGEHSLSTMLQSYWLPSIRSAIQMSRGNGTEALQALQPTIPYELGSAKPIPALYPVYLRGQALLLSHQGPAAVAEFQKMLAHSTAAILVSMSIAELQLARGYAMTKETAKAKDTYQHFLTIWKDADPDIPILQQAKSEFEKLH